MKKIRSEEEIANFKNIRIDNLENKLVHNIGIGFILHDVYFWLDEAIRWGMGTYNPILPSLKPEKGEERNCIDCTGDSARGCTRHDQHCGYTDFKSKKEKPPEIRDVTKHVFIEEKPLNGWEKKEMKTLEEEFDERFNLCLGCERTPVSCSLCQKIMPTDWRGIKSFLRSKIAEAVKESRKEEIEFLKALHPFPMPNTLESFYEMVEKIKARKAELEKRG